MSQVVTTLTVDASNPVWTTGPSNVLITQILSLKASGSVKWTSTLWTEIEGEYPTDGNPQNHVFDLGIRVNAVALAIIAVAAGTAPPLLFGGSRTTWLKPRWHLDADGFSRDTILTPSDFANASGVNGPWDIYYGFQDGNYTDNSGLFTVQSTVTDLDLQHAGLIGFPGAITQEDYNSAAICAASGYLFPGNRLVDTGDGRMVGDNYAPYKKLRTDL